jgi:hypothetical protein
MNKTLILASFVYPDRIENFLRFLKNRFNVRNDKVFVYDIIDDNSKKLLTYKIFIEVGDRVDLREFFPKTIIVHKKRNCFYTINALNLLIESESKNEVGNIDHSQYKVDWEEQQNKILLSSNGELTVYNIKRNFS